MTAFDPEAGVLRLGHAALAVLARLAVAPTDDSLTDHATAPPLAELRRAGILGTGGIHPDVRPLAEVLGAPQARLEIRVEDGGGRHRFRAWATTRLLVLGVPVPDAAETYDLMADVPSQAGGLIGELVGLSPGAAVAAEPVELERAVLDATPPGAPLPQADVLPGVLHVRWALVVDGRHEPAVEAADLGPGGLWTVSSSSAGSGSGDRIVLAPTDAAALRAAIDRAIGAALR